MPREQVTKVDYHQETPTSEVVETPKKHLHVGWNKVGQWVQVSLEVDPSYAQWTKDMAEKEARQYYAGRADMAVDEESFVAMQPVKLYSDSLSRSEINDLIRVLRRARDQAFGRDE